MYENAGEKILGLANVLCIIGIIASCLCGLVLMFINSDLFLSGLLVAVLGSLFSWLSSLTLAGFGELIVSTTEIRNMMAASARTQATPPSSSTVPSSGTVIAPSYRSIITPSAPPPSTERIPTWKRIQMEEEGQL